MFIEKMQEIARSLPENSRHGRKTIREVCITLDDDTGIWRVLAGGHNAVHIGEWGGDFEGEGQTPEEAFTACLKCIQGGK